MMMHRENPKKLFKRKGWKKLDGEKKDAVVGELDVLVQSAEETARFVNLDVAVRHILKNGREWMNREAVPVGPARRSLDAMIVGLVGGSKNADGGRKGGQKREGRKKMQKNETE